MSRTFRCVYGQQFILLRMFRLFHRYSDCMHFTANLSLESKQWFIDYFRQLARLGLSPDSNLQKPPGAIGPNSVSDYFCKICRFMVLAPMLSLAQVIQLAADIAISKLADLWQRQRVIDPSRTNRRYVSYRMIFKMAAASPTMSESESEWRTFWLICGPNGINMPEYSNGGNIKIRSLPSGQLYEPPSKTNQSRGCYWTFSSKNNFF